MTTELESVSQGGFPDRGDAGTEDQVKARAPGRGGYKPKHKIRLVTATALFDGHDAAINIIRRIAQASGAEVIHLGHNRSVEEIVRAAVQEDVHGIAVTSYQGGHNEFFRYMHDMLVEWKWNHVRIFGGGGGVILPDEIAALQEYGIARIYSPDDGRRMGLQGMINDMLQQCDFPTGETQDLEGLNVADHRTVSRALSAVENHLDKFRPQLAAVKGTGKPLPILGITGTGGAGKSSLMDELVRRFLAHHPDWNLAILSVDPSRRKTGGALLGDRIRMNAIDAPRVFMRSLATRQANLSLAGSIGEALQILRLAGFDMVFLESTGIGQSDSEITEHADVSLYVMTPEYGAATQLEKIDMLDYADLIAINKFDRRGAEDALRDVKKQFVRNHQAFNMPDEDIPVYGTTASLFNDAGVNNLYAAVMSALSSKTELISEPIPEGQAQSKRANVIAPERDHYMAEIVECNRRYNTWVGVQSDIAQGLYQLSGALQRVTDESARSALETAYEKLRGELDPDCLAILDNWDRVMEEYRKDVFAFEVRGRQVKVAQRQTSLSGLEIPKVSLPRFEAWGDRLRWALTENLPGRFPFAGGVFPFKRTQEDPTRMFAGEGGPERTNKRFHYLSHEQPAKRLSTAFDSVTLYGEDPDVRPDIYGKVGNAGVSICSLDDAKRLYSGFDLADPRTSVSMTINGPAPMLLAFFLNTAIDQQCEAYIREQGMEEEVGRKIDGLYKKAGLRRPRYRSDLPNGHSSLGLMLLGTTGDQVLPADVYAGIAARTMSAVRGTVQADILKEDQAQNTCIFSTEFALRMMGDIQAYFTEHKVRNFYSVSISGYHIAEAGANPITQLAFTLANGFTYVEYYLSRGLHIDDFAPNLSFFFSNGVDPEYAVIGRVARRIWAKAIKHKYGGGERAQKLKYHIQTSGRSLHAQEIAFNDIRTTLQALYAIYDNCNSLHTNAYDEAITTPTEESVRRAMAIQLIINKELGLANNENPLQGSFIIEELTDLVEEAVYQEFQRLSERGGVLGAMETMYQRGKIQQESIHYETLKSTGEMPIVGVNTFLSSEGSPIQQTTGVMRSSEEEKRAQIESLSRFWKRNEATAPVALDELKRTALAGGNTFEALMEAAKVCSLGQISAALYEVGGQYRRSM